MAVEWKAPRWMWDVLAGEDELLRKHESVFARSGESWIYTDLLPTGPRRLKFVKSKTKSYFLSQLLFVNILSPPPPTPSRLLSLKTLTGCSCLPFAFKDKISKYKSDKWKPKDKRSREAYKKKKKSWWWMNTRPAGLSLEAFQNWARFAGSGLLLPPSGPVVRLAPVQEEFPACPFVQECSSSVSPSPSACISNWQLCPLTDADGDDEDVWWRMRAWSFFFLFSFFSPADIAFPHNAWRGEGEEMRDVRKQSVCPG